VTCFLHSSSWASWTPLRRRKAPSSALGTAAASITSATFSSADQSCGRFVVSSSVVLILAGIVAASLSQRDNVPWEMPTSEDNALALIARGPLNFWTIRFRDCCEYGFTETSCRLHDLRGSRQATSVMRQLPWHMGEVDSRRLPTAHTSRRFGGRTGPRRAEIWMVGAITLRESVDGATDWPIFTATHTRGNVAYGSDTIDGMLPAVPEGNILKCIAAAWSVVKSPMGTAERNFRGAGGAAEGIARHRRRGVRRNGFRITRRVRICPRVWTASDSNQDSG
jgi:hypothetical protein